MIFKAVLYFSETRYWKIAYRYKEQHGRNLQRAFVLLATIIAMKVFKHLGWIP